MKPCVVKELCEDRIDAYDEEADFKFNASTNPNAALVAQRSARFRRERKVRLNLSSSFHDNLLLILLVSGLKKEP